jgi:hypothetical protein
MATNSLPDVDLAGLWPSRETVLYGALVVNAEFFLLATYLLATDTTGRSVWFYVYPFVWINLSLWAIVRTDLVLTSQRDRRVAAFLAGGYALLLAYFGGVVGPGTASFGFEVGGEAYAAGFRLAVDLPPGYGPALLYDGLYVRVSLLPYKLVGYGALIYLVYATALEAVSVSVSGLVGLLSCVSCSWPILTSLVTGVAGGSSAVAAAAFANSYGLSTLVFVVTVALLYWRPFGR